MMILLTSSGIKKKRKTLKDGVLHRLVRTPRLKEDMKQKKWNKLANCKSSQERHHRLVFFLSTILDSMGMISKGFILPNKIYNQLQFQDRPLPSQ